MLRAESVNPPGNEAGAASIVEGFLSSAGLDVNILTSPEGRPNVIARIEGRTDKPALVLLSHSDVVPVEEEKWSRDPFGGEVAEGFLWGRGALDMKNIAAMHCVAASELIRTSATPAREVIVAVVADEEAGGEQGARWLLEEHPESVGFREGRPPPEVMGEGAYGLSGALDEPVMPIALGEKTVLWFDLVATGEPGHGALPPQRQAPAALAALVKEIAGFGTPRVHPVLREQFLTLTAAASGPVAAIFRALASPAGDVVARAVAPQMRKAGAIGFLLSDSMTPTQMNAGYKTNVVPGEARASFDCRLLPDTDLDDFIAAIDKKAQRHGGHVTNVQQKGRGPVSEKGPLFDVMTEVTSKEMPEAVVTPSLSPAVTDLRFFRARGASAYGWCPLVLTPELLATIHGHDERVPVEDFERSVSIATEVVRRAAT